MKIDLTQHESHLVATPAGPRLDALHALAFKENLRKSVETLDQDIVIDMVNIEFMDSSGLGVLVAVAKLVPDGCGFAFCNLQSLVARVFQLTHLDRVYTVLPTETGTAA
ncbi:MAG: STAS domain-containing protein [Pseudomonadota bacterium]